MQPVTKQRRYKKREWEASRVAWLALKFMAQEHGRTQYPKLAAYIDGLPEIAGDEKKRNEVIRGLEMFQAIEVAEERAWGYRRQVKLTGIGRAWLTRMSAQYKEEDEDGTK